MIKTKLKKPRGETVFIILMLAYPLAHMLFFSFYLNISNFGMSLFRYDGDRAIFVGFYNYQNVWQDLIEGGSIFYSIINSLTLLPINLCLLLPISILFSYFIYKKICGYRAFRVIFFLPSIMSIVTLVMAFKYMFDSSFGPMTLLFESLGLGKINWFGTRDSAYAMLALFNLWSGVGYQILLIQGAMLRIPGEVMESGQLDGAGMATEMFRLVIPLVFSNIATMALYSVMGIFTSFVVPQLLFGVGNDKYYTLALYIVKSTGAGGKNGQASAATIGTLITIIAGPLMIGLRALLNKLTPDVEY